MTKQCSLSLSFQSKDKEWHTGFKKKPTQEPIICCLQEIHLRTKDTYTDSEGMEKDISCKWKWQESKSCQTLISDKIDFKAKAIKTDKEGHI